MSTYINNNVKFHTFSKSPVSGDTTLGGAVNPSGHTITTSQVRSEDIPAFLNSFQGIRNDAITWLETNYTTPVHNDIAYYGGEFKEGFDTPKCLKYNAKAETPAWEDFDITKATTLKNADDKDVIAVHTDCTTVFVDGGNNAATNSNRWSLFVKKSDGTILDHFVASTDKIVAGMPSLGYNALVLWNGAAIDEGEFEDNYVGNTFTGIIHLNKQYSTGDDAKFKVTCFEYIGDNVRSYLSDLETTIDDLDIAYKEANRELESKLYTDFSFDSFEEGNDNYGTAYGFIIDENIFGKIKNIKIKCANYERNDRTYLKITDENNNVIGCSETDVEHGANRILNFEFKNVTLERGKTYKAIFSSTNSITDISAYAACVRVNHEGNANHTAPSLVTPVLDSNFNIQLGNDGKPVYAIAGFDISVAVNDLAVIIQNNQLNHINDRIKHIFPEDYSYGNLNYTDFPFRGISTSYGYGFIWKPETSAHISNIAISLKTGTEIYIYNPGKLSESILNAAGPISMCIKITDSSNNKVIGTSRLINIPAGAKNYQIISIPFDTLVPCVKNKTYIVTYHSSETAEKPDVVLPVNFSFLEDDKPITTDYTIKKLIIDTDNNEFYTDDKINDYTLNSDNYTYMSDAYLEHLCIKISTTRYTHPELELIANSIGDIWEYLGSMRTYISQL